MNFNEIIELFTEALKEILEENTAATTLVYKAGKD